MERQIRREPERLGELSDDGGRSVKELKRKIEAVERALAHLSFLGADA